MAVAGLAVFPAAASAAPVPASASARVLTVTPAVVAPAAAQPAAVSSLITATGDPRTVTQPSIPGTICATVSSGLQMASRVSSAANEAAPPDTPRIQKALDTCAQTGSATVAVKLVASDSTHAAFLSGPLTIHRGEVLLLDSPVTLYASRNPANYQVSGKPTCGTLSTSEGGCSPFITVSGANAGVEAVQASGGSQGRIDGRGDQTILNTSTTWWGLATQAQSAGENQQNPRLLQANSSDNFTLYDVDLLDSPNFHVVYNGGTGFTAWGVRIQTPATARNTDGIDPAGATDVTIANSWIMDGDDGIAIKGGSAASKNITVVGNHFYGTHGISIGSETNSGVSNILVENNTLTGTDSLGNVSGSSTGIRIKSSPSNGGPVTNVGYSNTCVTAVRAPLDFDAHYSSGTGSLTPQFTGIVVAGFKATSSPSNVQSVFDGLDSGHLMGITLAGVSVDNTSQKAEYAQVKVQSSNLAPSGTGVTVTTVSGSTAVPSCSFPTFPAL
jgi:polygalacturonase